MMKSVNVLRNYGDLAPLRRKASLECCNGRVGRIGELGPCDFTTIAIELPNEGGVVFKGLRCG